MNQVGKPVLGKDLIGREQELRLIKELLLAGQSVVIIAPRRMGKTSLMIELINQFKEENFFITHVDVFSTSNIPSLARRIVESVFSNNKVDKYFRLALVNLADVFKNISFKGEIEDYSFILEFNNKAKSAPFELLEDSINMIDSYALKNKKPMLAAFDEFGDIKKLDGEHIVKLFRSVIQLQKNTVFLFSGSYESIMNELFVGKNSPFYRMTRIVELGNILPKDFIPHINKKAEENNIELDESRVQQILDFTNGHPYYTQLYLQQLIINFKLSTNNQIASHEQIIEQLLIVEKSFLEKNWEDVSRKKEDKIVLTHIANDTSSLYSAIDNKTINIARALASLKDQGIISHRNSTIKMIDPLFKIWIINNIIP
jgi:AAA+ ATPase superfamily predicted ATPase